MSGYIYVSPKANNYPGLDRGFNQRFTLENDLTETKGEGVYLASSTNDVLNALVDINNSHSPLSGEIRVISGGHCYEDFTFNRRVTSSTSNKTRFVIDLSNMRNIDEVTINGTDYITVEPGASNWLIQQTLHSKYGAALPGDPAILSALADIFRVGAMVYSPGFMASPLIISLASKWLFQIKLRGSLSGHLMNRIQMA